jgi:uncharacterized repeat protein (TIGR01451 family)
MAHVRDALVSKAGRAVMAAGLLLGVVTVVPVFSGSASAHKADISAEVACDGTVTWTARSWSTDHQGENPDVRVVEHHDSASSTSADSEVGKGSFGGSQGYRFSGSFHWPSGASKVVVSSKPVGEWGSGHESNDSDSVEIVEPKDCDHHPEVGKVVECEDTSPGHGDGVVDMTLTNPAGPFGHSSDFSVDSPDGSGSSTYRVAAGDHQHVVYHHLSEGHHTIHVHVGDQDMSQDVEVHCDQAVPSVTVSQACVASDGSVTVNLANTGGAEAVLTVEDPTSHAVETITLAAGTNTSRTFSGLADGKYRISVKAGDTDLSQYVEVKCDKVEVQPPPVCENGGHPSGGTESSSPDSSPENSTPSSYQSFAPRTSSSTYTSTSVEGEHTSTSEGEHTSTSEAPHPCEPPKAEGRIEVAKACVNADGQVTVTLIAKGKEGAAPVHFVVEGQSFTVQVGTNQQVVLSGLSDGEHSIHVTANGYDLSFHVEIHCNESPRVTVTQECVAFHGSVSLLLENLGDDDAATFTINGVDHVVAAGASETVVIDGLPDGTTTLHVAINGYAVPDVVLTFSCLPIVHVVAECNAVAADGAVQTYWYTITNTEATDVQVSWDLGTALVPAGQSRTIGSHLATLSLAFDGTTIATADAATVACSRAVTFQKQLIGAPAQPETYSVKVSRLVGDAFVDITTFDLVAGTPKTINLPSTLDPAGIQYKVVEVGRGTASTSVVTPDALTLSGNLGSTINVTITNGYASVSLAKQASLAQVGVGTQFDYTLSATNTGGLTLDPAIVFDRLPAAVTFVSGSVAGDGGSCVLDQSAHPQLVKCALTAALAAGAVSPAITITVRVDTTATVGSALQNQAKVVGAFGPAGTLTEAQGAPLSCTPVVDGTVCALSARVSTTVVDSNTPVPTTTTTAPGATTTTVRIGGPVPTTTTPTPTTVASGGPIPNGGSNTWPLMVVAAVLVGIGAVLSRARRRPVR